MQPILVNIPPQEIRCVNCGCSQAEALASPEQILIPNDFGFGSADACCSMSRGFIYAARADAHRWSTLLIEQQIRALWRTNVIHPPLIRKRGGPA